MKSLSEGGIEKRSLSEIGRGPSLETTEQRRHDGLAAT
jgi:hypothetical protein